MAKFILAFRGGMPKSEEEGRKMMDDWNAWMGKLGDALTDPGAGFGKSRFLIGGGQEGEPKDALSGYSIVEANDIEAAIAMANDNPIFALGGTIEVAPLMTM